MRLQKNREVAGSCGFFVVYNKDGALMRGREQRSVFPKGKRGAKPHCSREAPNRPGDGTHRPLFAFVQKQKGSCDKSHERGSAPRFCVPVGTQKQKDCPLSTVPATSLIHLTKFCIISSSLLSYCCLPTKCACA